MTDLNAVQIVDQVAGSKLNTVQHRAWRRRKDLVVQGNSHTDEEIVYAVKW
jgi:hypothetical protein